VPESASTRTPAAGPASSPSEASLRAFLQTAALLTEEAELDDLVAHVLDRLLAVSGTERGCILLSEQGEMNVKAQRGLGPGGPAAAGALQAPMAAARQAFDSGEAVWSPGPPPDGAAPAAGCPGAVLCLPMQVQGKRIGALYLEGRNPIPEAMDRPLLEAMVSLGAIAIERTRLAEENLRNQVLATVGKVASSIVHDFKNGLFVIAGHAQLLGLTASDPNTRHHLAQIRGAAERLGQLSMDILDYSKVREPRRESVDLARFLEAQVEPLQPRAQESEVELVCQGPPCQASLDRHRFNRVIENLLANALDALAGQEGGRVVLGWAPLEDGGATIQVADNGKGIPRKIQKRIFEPFFSHGKTRGTGLGMATVNRIMAEHGGTVDVASEEGRGTTVTLHLPGPARIAKPRGAAQP
jgi:signal transduction histidine kinase